MTDRWNNKIPELIIWFSLIVIHTTECLIYQHYNLSFIFIFYVIMMWKHLCMPSYMPAFIIWMRNSVPITLTMSHCYFQVTVYGLYSFLAQVWSQWEGKVTCKCYSFFFILITYTCNLSPLLTLLKSKNVSWSLVK